MTDPALPEPAVVAMVRDQPGGRAWLDGLAALVAGLERDWGLRAGSPWTDGTTSWTTPAVDREGRYVVLKVVWPHDEAAGEATALAHWGGNGAVRLLRHDPGRWALLLERCQPGLPLRDDPAPVDDRLAAGAGILRRLWEVPPPSPPLPVGLVPVLSEVAARWATLAQERATATSADHDPGLVELGIGLLRDLPSAAEREVLLHGDANPGNMLRAGRGWLAIDPKPMLGDPAYDPWPLLTQLGDPFDTADPTRVLRRRCAVAADLLDLPVARLLAWSVARSVEMALWEDAQGRVTDAVATMRRVRVLAGLLG